MPRPSLSVVKRDGGRDRESGFAGAYASAFVERRVTTAKNNGAP